MIRKFTIILAIAVYVANFVACNEDKTYEYTTVSGAAINSFSISADDKILENLDSVFFTIDLIKGQIYNADSLPFGTNVTRLVPIITTTDGASLAELTVKRAGESDTTYNYLTNSTDSIDFTNPVNLRVVSADGTAEKNYTITVNVHKVVADSLAWSQAERLSLPSLFSIPNEQHTVIQNDKIHCLTRYESKYCLATSEASRLGDKNSTNKWNHQYIEFGFTPNINSFTASDDALYILSDSGELYTSANGLSWNTTGLKWHSIYMGYQSTVLGSVKDGDAWLIQQYPGNKLSPLPNNMPVSGTSNPVTYSFTMGQNPQTYIVGGRKADGSLTGATWGFDGDSWCKISAREIPVALEGMVVIPFYTFKVNSDWTTTTYPTIIATGGRKADRTIESTVYVSNDYGYSWNKASSLMQLPEYIPAMYNSQAVVVNTTFDAKSRVSKPLESWECPYIYLFGGVNAEGATYNTLWKGTINRLTFKPIQ